ncbi:MAG: neutral/alkaline non-lysosomal ceramidase N-terminal domain-containing protein [Sedimentisphaerales bacterium]|nr:neutral/alkaline non-lysosomal ceramidase N-terminal domain-containing protein [Sedimentisphaerales bacterium]
MERISVVTCRGILVAVTFLLFASSNVHGQESAEVLRAGVARIDITPKEPVTLSGYASRKDLSKGVHDPLSARAVAFVGNGKRLVLVSTDVIGFYDGTAEYLRKVILAKFNLRPGELFLAGIHTHAAPTLTLDKDKGHENNLKYTETLEGKILKVIEEALDSPAPVGIGCGIGYSPVGSNRREVRLDGAGWPKEAIKLGRNPYGPTDKQVLVAKVAGSDGAPVAVLFDYATHGTSLGPQNYIISGDVLGLAEQFVEKVLAPGVIAPAFAGASGDIDPWYRILPEFNTEAGWIPEPVLLGTLLGEEVVHVYRDIKETNVGAKIESAFITMALPRKPGENPDDKTKDPTASLNITAGRVGDIGFIGFGCEMCTEIGMAIKAASPFKHTFVITHCNGAAGYLPTKDMYKEGGYEVRSSSFAPQAAEIVIKQSLKMLYQL